MSAPPPEGGTAPEPLGLAHVASCSFLASRLAPSLQFFLALGGGVALARAAATNGLRAGYGASVAAMVQTVALIGPARFNAPLTQALNAPVLGHLRDASRAVRLAVCLTIRLVHYAVLNVVFVAVVIGGLHEFVRTYDKVTGFIERVISLPVPGDVRFFPHGQTAAVVMTSIGSVFYALIFSTIQVLVYERALARWPDGEEPALPARGPRARPRRVFFAPALVAIAWTAMLGWLDWRVLGATALGLAVVTFGTSARRAGRATWRIGFALAAVLAVGALVPALFGAVGLEPAGQRAVRGALLVLTATWARAYAGSDGLREFGRRVLWGHARRIIGELESDARLRPAADDLIERLSGVDTRPAPLADALTEWVAAEARSYRPPA